jgi:AcrR family transcriptional regulator
MSRTPDQQRRAELLERIIDYVYERGVGQLSLRPLGQAVGCSPRLLLYFFGSKDELVTQVLAAAGARQRALVSKLQMERVGSPGEACREIWKAISEPKSEPIFRLFFEVYGQALQDRERYTLFLERVVDDWLAFIAQPMIASGWKPEEAQAYATIVLAGFRGFLLDLCTTHQYKRVNRAVDVWLRMLDASSSREIAS